MNTKKNFKTYRLTLSAIMIALATALAVICGLIPGISLPYGGSFTIASMLPIVIVSYIFGLKWGLFTSLTYALIQMILDILMGKSSVILALFLPIEDGGQPLFYAICIIFIDYILAYGILFVGGAFRKMKKRTLGIATGALVATSCRYLCHILSGYIFYGSYAEWFFSSPDQFPAEWGQKILSIFDGQVLALIYSAVYNGLYMLPEIVITTVAAVIISRIPQIRPGEINS
ncbi:MAG: energy-coupled thiamine transporter ThiT [Clostridia bacterium]|nr:energy-coupled thiamine transporter ThiT [Clostridia bacterium]